ncbi:MAG: H(+)/Cl(-) exchange transporter ClcA [Rhodospirillales bacterium]|nr:H(+)/Cl(-) exchange transporter ClcA [Rhodospirillales bacterium]
MTYSGRFLALAAVVGVLTGLLSTGFQVGIALVIGGYAAVVRRTAEIGVPGWIVAASLSAVMVSAAVLILRRIAPEAAGSGIHEVEAHIDGVRPLRWKRVLPVKFVGGILALGANLTVGPEGPVVHMGGAVGRMLADRFHLRGEHGKALVCAGAGAGIAAVFNAPLAGFLFVLEQMRRHFSLTVVSFHGLVLACVSAAIVTALFFGQGPAFPIKDYPTPALLDLTLFVALGAGIGAAGTLFNRVLITTIEVFERVRRWRPLVVAPMIGAATGVLVVVLPHGVGSGQALTLKLFLEPFGWQMLVLLLVVRLLTTLVSYAAEAPGGIFAPLLAIGAITGLAFGQLFGALFPGLVAEPGVYALAAMGALFAATLRIPLTAIVLVIEITNNVGVSLAIIASCLAASLAAQALGAKPLYEDLLERLIARQKRHLGEGEG